METTARELNEVFFTQTFPWGLVYWDIMYNPASQIELQIDSYHEWLQDRKQRDGELPSIATKPRWQEIHFNERSRKGHYHGNISSLVSAADFNKAELERSEERLSKRSTTDRLMKIPLNKYFQ